MTIFIYFWETDLFFQIFCPFFNYIACLFTIEFVGALHTFEIWALYQIYALQIFSPRSWVIFTLSWCCTLRHKSFNFEEVQSMYFFITCAFDVLSKKSLHNLTSQRVIPTFFSNNLNSFHSYIYVYNILWANFCIWSFHF